MSDIFGEEDVELPQDEPENLLTPEPEPEATPEPEPEAKSSSEPVKPTVPIDALHAARREAQELRAKMAQMEQQLGSVSELREQLNAQRQAAQNQTEEQRFQADPLGAIREDIQSLKEQQERSAQSAEEAQQQQISQEQFNQTVQSQVAAFTKDHEDYPQALEHVLTARAEEMRLVGVPEPQIQNALNQESVQLAQAAVQNGQNPAEIIYNLAKLRGYASGPAPEPTATVANISKGQAASSSLADTQGSEAPAEIGLADIERMSDEEFDEYWKKEIEPSRS